MNRGTEAVWPTPDGFALLCDCGAVTRVHVSFAGPDGSSLPPPEGQIVIQEQAVTCGNCGSAHWLTITPKEREPVTPQQIVAACARMCQCGHGEGFHNIARSGARSACSVIEGARGRRCPCKRFREKGQTP